MQNCTQTSRAIFEPLGPWGSASPLLAGVACGWEPLLPRAQPPERIDFTSKAPVPIARSQLFLVRSRGFNSRASVLVVLLAVVVEHADKPRLRAIALLLLLLRRDAVSA